MRYLFTIAALIFLVGCNNNLTIADLESVGFQKEQQKFYQMIGAIDGWSGVFEGEIVEIYQFQTARFEIPSGFSTITDEGNISGWQGMCRTKNLLMLSKGREACKKLKTL